MKKQGILAAFFTALMIFFVAVNVNADNDISDLSNSIQEGDSRIDEIQSLYDEMQDKIDELELNKENLSDYLASLNESYEAAQALIDSLNQQIIAKQSDIQDINEQLEEAESRQTDQYEDMKLRIQYMYESGDMNIVNVIMSDHSLGEILNQVEYISQLMEYDRSKMEEYENLLLTITVMRNQAEEEMKNLNQLKAEQESISNDLSALMSEASENIKAHEEQIDSAEQEALQYEEEIRRQKNSVEALKQEESRRIAESIAESIRSSEIESMRAEGIDVSEFETTTSAYQADVDDLKRMAAIIYCEAGGEPYEGQLAVGTVVMNRVASPKYPDTIEGVLTQPYQFTPVGSGRYAIALAKEPDPSCLRAATEILINGKRTGPWLYFRTVNNIIQGTVIGNQVFY